MSDGDVVVNPLGGLAEEFANLSVRRVLREFQITVENISVRGNE